MIYKPRYESLELLTLRYLSSRKTLLEKENQYYLSLEKGYEGEVKFDRFVEPVLTDWLLVNDLLLSHNNSFFQIDSLGITQDTIYLFDVKNFDGDFIVEGDTWKYLTTGKDIKNPLHQLQRCESLLKRMLEERGIHFPIKAFLIFINPEFTLYQAPLNPSIIFPTQLTQFIGNLSKERTALHGKHHKLAEYLVSVNQEGYPNPFVPKYEYGELCKGITCAGCGALIINKPLVQQKWKLTCDNCFFEENMETIVLRSVKEIQLLFPEIRVNTTEVHEWCNGLINTKKIQRVLTQHYERKGRGKSSFYVM